MVDKLIKTLNGKQPQVHPNCFYLSWEPPYNAIWTDIRNVTPKWSTTVKWKEMRGDIYIASNQALSKQPMSLDPVYASYKNKSFLKSHLQKTVRMSNKYKALKTAFHFLYLDQEEFLRRLTIIAVEDALPLQGLCTIIWLQVAVSKGYILTDEHVGYIMGYVHDICVCDKYEQIEHHGSKGDMRLLALKADGRDLVYSLLLRKAYGGLKSDQEMLSAFSFLWASRYHACSEHISLLQRKPIFMTPSETPLEINEWMLSAIDFHCCPQIISTLWEKHDELKHEEIQGAIWHCSSSITNKKNIGIDFQQRHETPELLSIWKVIKRDFYSYGKFALLRETHK
jgi:hypothetical protein